MLIHRSVDHAIGHQFTAERGHRSQGFLFAENPRNLLVLVDAVLQTHGVTDANMAHALQAGLRVIALGGDGQDIGIVNAACILDHVNRRR